MPNKLFNLSPLLLMVASGIWLGACGGGGGDGGQSAAPPAGSSNAAPVIAGQPASTVAPAQSYTFQPSASDPEGGVLTFSATNLPAWLRLDSTTGRLYGTPSSADIGSYSGIAITVSDGRAATQLSPFSISVTDVGSGSATLSWTPPTQNSDGTALLNLAGYEVRYGRSQDDMSSVVSLTNPSLSVYVIENLTSGTWYFAVASMNSTGASSPLSNVASKTIG
jgi:hypothetical protein